MRLKLGEDKIIAWPGGIFMLTVHGHRQFVTMTLKGKESCITRNQAARILVGLRKAKRDVDEQRQKEVQPFRSS